MQASKSSPSTVSLGAPAQVIIFITLLLFAFKVYASGLYPIGSIEKVWNNLNRMAEPDAVPVAGAGPQAGTPTCHA
jgi:hypothetical protein